VVLAELLSLRTIQMNLLFSIAGGEAAPPEQMQALIERADRDKMRRALEQLGETRLTPYLVPGGYGAEVFEDVIPTHYPKNRIQSAFTHSHRHLASETLCYALSATGKDFNARRKLPCISTSS
jgi:hypothetical protein